MVSEQLVWFGLGLVVGPCLMFLQNWLITKKEEKELIKTIVKTFKGEQE